MARKRPIEGKEIEAIEHAGSSKETLEPLKKKPRRRLQQVMEDPLEAIASQSIDRQISSYGKEQWHQEFIWLDEITEIKGMSVYGRNLQLLVFNALPDGKYKRFVEAYCASRIPIPKTFKAEGGRIWFEHIPDSIAGCPVDFRSISKDHIERLGFIPLTKLQEDSVDYSEAIDANTASVKKMWDSAQPLQEGNNRIFVISKPSEEIEQRYPNVVNPDSAAMGALLYMREERPSDLKPYKYRNKTVFPPRNLVVSYFDTAYNAIRKTHHQEQRYTGKETDTLVNIEGDIVDAFRLLSRVDRFTPQEIVNDIRQDIDALIKRGEETLQHVRNPHKVEVRRKLEVLREKVRGNVSATMATLLGARHSTQNRKAEIPRISGFNADDRLALHLAIESFEDEFKKKREVIIKRANLLPRLRLDPATIKGFTEHFRMREDADGLLLRPFNVYRKVWENIVGALQEHLLQEDLERAKLEMLKLHVVGKLQELRSSIEDLKLILAHKKGLSLVAAHTHIKQIQEVLERREIYEGFDNEDLQGLYGPFEFEVSDLFLKLEYIAQAREEKEFTERAEEFETRLDRLKIEEIIEEVAQIAL